VKGARILLLEDDRETRWALATVLRREGCRVTEAADGEDGLKFLARNAYDLCISDVCMPGVGGFGFFSAMRFGVDPELASRKRIPVLLMSGKVPTRELAQALDAGVDDFMEKPVDPEEFKARVRAALRRARASGAPTARTNGDLADFSVAALAQTLCLGSRTARLKVQTGAVCATLDFQRGALRHAVIEGPSVSVKGDAAAVEALCFHEGTFEILPIPESVPHTVFAETQSLLLRATTLADQLDELTNSDEMPQPTSAASAPAATATSAEPAPQPSREPAHSAGEI
jgi:DNA-binding response OmpR family regulator